MATSAIGQVSSSNSATSISQDDFIKILTTQLSFQDPLKPMDNQQFMAQMAQFAALEQSRQANDTMVQQLAAQGVSQAVGLLNRIVEVGTSGGNAVGTVTTVRFVDGAPLITVQTSGGQFLADLPLSSVTVVRQEN